MNIRNKGPNLWNKLASDMNYAHHKKTYKNKPLRVRRLHRAGPITLVVVAGVTIK